MIHSMIAKVIYGMASNIIREGVPKWGRQKYILDKLIGRTSLTAFGSTIIISLLLLFNTNYYFSSTAHAQRTTPRSNETQTLDEGTSSTTIESQNQNPNSEVTNTPSRTSQITSELGSSGEDLMSGTQGNDLILGLQGADTIRGNGGSDVIQGDEDPDKLYGGEGDDIIQGGQGSDLIYGENGNDILSGGLDDDMLSGGTGNDKIYGGEGDDVLQGGPGADFFDCGDGIDIVIDSNVTEGDDSAGNCEELLNNIVVSGQSPQIGTTG
jgi:Ca2+-binding RTX toxin-like protein